jgi:hypothetical protein
VLATKRVVGHCTVGCGACCRHVILAKPPDWGVQKIQDDDGVRLAIALPLGLTEEGRYFYETRGMLVSPHGRMAVWRGNPRFREVQHGGRTALLVESPCPHLTEQGLCDLHGTDRQPQVCRDYPTVHTDLSAVADVCTFKIEGGDDG